FLWPATRQRPEGLQSLCPVAGRLGRHLCFLGASYAGGRVEFRVVVTVALRAGLRLLRAVYDEGVHAGGAEPAALTLGQAGLAGRLEDRLGLLLLPALLLRLRL